MSCGRQSQEPLILGPPNRIHLILAEPHDYSHNNYQFYHQAEQQMLYKYQIYTSRPQPRPRLLHLLYMLLIAVIQVLPIILSINTFHFQKRKQNKTKNHQQNQKKKQICFVFCFLYPSFNLNHTFCFPTAFDCDRVKHSGLSFFIG